MAQKMYLATSVTYGINEETTELTGLAGLTSIVGVFDSYEKAWDAITEILKENFGDNIPMYEALLGRKRIYVDKDHVPVNWGNERAAWALDQYVADLEVNNRLEEGVLL